MERNKHSGGAIETELITYSYCRLHILKTVKVKSKDDTEQLLQAGLRTRMHIKMEVQLLLQFTR